MDLLAEKTNIPNEVYDLVKKMKIKNNRIVLLGSASLQSQQYFSDYDFYSSIVDRPNENELRSELDKILELSRERIEDNIYFIELKIELRDGKKMRVKKMDKLPKKLPPIPSIKFIKIDLALFFDFEFVEVSVMYDFEKIVRDKNQYKASLKEDIDELIKEKQYYKVLKRLFSLYRIDKDYEKLLQLNEIFNSELGEKYKKISNLKTLSVIKDEYNDYSTHKKIIINLKALGENSRVKNVENRADVLEEQLNNEAKKIYEAFVNKNNG